MPPSIGVVAYTEYHSDPRVRREAEALALAGYDIFVIALRPSERLPTQNTHGVQLIELPLTAKRGGRLRYLYQYSMFLLLSSVVLTYLGIRHRFGLVHVHSLPDFQLFCALPLYTRKTSLLLDLHEAMPEILAARFHLGMDSVLIRLAILLEQLSCRAATHVITANDAIRARIISRGIAPDHVTVIYNAPTPVSTSASPSDFRSSLHLGKGLLIVHAGAINRERDLETLFRAAATLQVNTQISIVVAGKGDPGYVRELVALAARLRLLERVKFVGNLAPEDAKNLLALSEIGLVTLEDNPLTRLALPTRVLEFVSLSKPLVLPSLPYLEEIIGEGAEYYAPGNPESLKQAVENVLRHPENGRVKIEIARTACARFNWGTSQASFLALCDALGGRRAH